MTGKSILISGAGIAGTTLAFWLSKFGFHPVIVEHAPALRKGGYGIDFWGAGYEVAERMGIISDLQHADLGISEVVFVDADDRRRSSLNYVKLKQLMKGRAFTLLRSDLARIVYDALDAGTEIIFNDTITAIDEVHSGVRVRFRSGLVRDFDLVIGADGLHSKVRSLIFGEETQFEQFYGYYVSSYTMPALRSTGRSFHMYGIPGKQITAYSTKDNQTTVLCIFSAAEKLSIHHNDVRAQKQRLHDEFVGTGWQSDDLLAGMELAPDFYFDVVSQIKMKEWSKGRVALVGDASSCPSLLSGQGSTLAMVGAYILAGELKNAAGDFHLGFLQYQSVFKPFLDSKQKIAQTFAKSLVPKTRFGMWMRDLAVRLMFFPLFSKMFVKQFDDADLNLKKY
jgi:2-polyprenyl-6-methoxyphenol hydroxylase-like FAD-dependent oxidoreductase